MSPVTSKILCDTLTLCISFNLLHIVHDIVYPHSICLTIICLLCVQGLLSNPSLLCQMLKMPPPPKTQNVNQTDLQSSKFLHLHFQLFFSFGKTLKHNSSDFFFKFLSVNTISTDLTNIACVTTAQVINVHYYQKKLRVNCMTTLGDDEREYGRLYLQQQDMHCECKCSVKHHIHS